MQFAMPDDLVDAVKWVGTPAPDWRAETGRLGTRERESLLKLVIGMAVGKYDFDPMTGRRSIAADIAHDLALAGLPMDEDTVRKYVAAGKDRLPRNKTE
jgi:hypothetical protein